MNIALIGYRGAGKTSVSSLLSKKLGYKLVSTDKEIEKRLGMPIPEIVKKLGWKKFRDEEQKFISGFRDDSCVLDTGGGIIENPQNTENLKKHSKIILLTANIETIKERIANSNRPQLTNKSTTEEIEEVLKKRMPLYKQAADYEIDTTNLSIEQVSEKILQLVKNE